MRISASSFKGGQHLCVPVGKASNSHWAKLHKCMERVGETTQKALNSTQYQGALHIARHSNLSTVSVVDIP